MTETDSPNNIDQKMGINWKYLHSLLENYEKMIEYQTIFLNSLGKSITDDEQEQGISPHPQVTYKRLASVTYTFFVAVESQFKKYFDKNKDKLRPITYNDFINIFIDANKNHNPQKLLTIVRILSFWSSTEGPFATLIQTDDPESQW